MEKLIAKGICAILPGQSDQDTHKAERQRERVAGVRAPDSPQLAESRQGLTCFSPMMLILLEQRCIVRLSVCGQGLQTDRCKQPGGPCSCVLFGDTMFSLWNVDNLRRAYTCHLSQMIPSLCYRSPAGFSHFYLSGLSWHRNV